MHDTQREPRDIDDCEFDGAVLPNTPIGDVAREMTEAIASAPSIAHVKPAKPKSPTELEPRVTSLASTLTAIAVITDAAAYVALGGNLKLVKALLHEIDETFDPIIDAQRAALDAARAQKKRHADPLLAAERHGKLLMRTFDDELQRLADDEQRRADAAELARAHDDRLEEAFEAEVAGRHEAAEIILQTPVITAPVVVTKTTPKIDGITHKPNWKGVCTDLAKLVLAAAAELVNPDRTRPRLAFSMLQAKQSEITKQAKALKHELNRVPGMRAWDEKTTSVKA
jgi:hypothetical protein